MPDLPFEMEDAVQKVVPEGVQRPMDVRSLPASMAIFAGQIRTAVQAIILVRVSVVTRARLDGPRQYRARRCITDRLEIRHDLSPFADIMRAPALMLAPHP